MVILSLVRGIVLYIPWVALTLYLKKYYFYLIKGIFCFRI